MTSAAWPQNPAPAPDGALQPPPKPNEEMVKWIATVDAQWQTTFSQEVTIPFDTEKAKAAQQYGAAVEANLAKAAAAGNLDATLLWRGERDEFALEKTVAATDDAAAPPELKQLRATWRTQMARLAKERAARAKSVHARYDQVLAQAQTALTQKHRIEDALLVKQRRDEIAAVWLVQEAAAAPEKMKTAETVPAPATASAPAELLGTWKVTWPNNGWVATRTFKADGTMDSSDAGAGTWQVIGETLVANMEKYQERFELPLKPVGTRVIGHKNRELVATKESTADGRAVVKVAAPTPKPTLGTATIATLAQVEAQDIVLSPLSEGERVWNDRDYKFKKITGWHGYQYTRSNAHSPYLRFKVLSNGLVYMACTARWGSAADPVTRRELKTEKDLLAEGWTRIRRGDIDTGDGNISFVVFSRMCTAGEQFTYRTDKNAAPILLLKK
ncbi:MAG: hypothetical protein ABMA13_21695 [Chthoniobacteraceae bacterium]